ncbi:hypothetical protein [Streptomyces sp. NPDC002825]
MGAAQPGAGRRAPGPGVDALLRELGRDADPRVREAVEDALVR